MLSIEVTIKRAVQFNIVKISGGAQAPIGSFGLPSILSSSNFLFGVRFLIKATKRSCDGAFLSHNLVIFLTLNTCLLSWF